MVELLRIVLDPEKALGVSPHVFYGALVAVITLPFIALWVTRLVRARMEAARRERRRLQYELSEMGRESREEEEVARRRRAEANQRQLTRYEAGETTTMTRPRISTHSSATRLRDGEESTKPGLRYRKRQ